MSEEKSNGSSKTYDVSPPHEGSIGIQHVDVNVHDENGNVVERITHVNAVIDGDSHTVEYYDAVTGEHKGSSSWDNTVLHTGKSENKDD